MRLRQQMNLLKKRTDEVITLKKAQNIEKKSIIVFNSEDSMSFLHLNTSI